MVESCTSAEQAGRIIESIFIVSIGDEIDDSDHRYHEYCNVESSSSMELRPPVSPRKFPAR